MKIAYIVFRFPPSYVGGTEIATLNISKEISKNHEVHVFTKKTKRLKSDFGFHVHYVGIDSKIHIIDLIGFSLGIIFPLLKIKPNVIHEQTISPINIISILIKKLLGVPYIVWGQGFDVYMNWPCKKLITKFVLKHSEIIIALSDDMKNRLLESHKRTNIIIIPNGIDMCKFARHQEKNKIKNTLDIVHDKKIILFVGTLKKVKGVEYLIEAIKYTVQDYPNLLLLIVGDGDNMNSLKSLVERYELSDFVSFKGGVQNEEIPYFMALADIFVLPSLSESFGIVLLEAMASGIPIVASNVGGIPSLIENGENGFLVEPKSPEQIADKIKLLLADSEVRAYIGRNNKKKSKNYSWESIAKELEMIYFEVSKES